MCCLWFINKASRHYLWGIGRLNKGSVIMAKSKIKTILTGVVLSVFVVCLCSACNTNASKTSEASQGMEETKENVHQTIFDAKNEQKRRIIIDVDAGADDSSALMLAAREKNVEILGVTVLPGNADIEQGTRNALAALEAVGCNAPVFKGSESTFTGERKEHIGVYGNDGMGDANLIHPKGKPEEMNAIDFILKTVKENPDEIELIVLGPATNIAKAIERDPEVMKHVKRIWSMGTAGLGAGNATPIAEFNVYMDAPAYKVMLDSGIPITIVGLDMCQGDAMWTDNHFEQLESSSELGEFVSQSFNKLRSFYKENGYGDKVTNCDSLAMMCALHPGFITETISAHGSCITDPGETYGAVLFYAEGFTYDSVDNNFNYNVTLVTKAIKEDYFNLFFEKLM